MKIDQSRLPSFFFRTYGTIKNMRARQQADQLRGRIGHATVAILTITSQEFDGVRSVFDLRQELLASPYAVQELNSTNDYPIVLRRAAGQTNVVSAQIAAGILEDFRPSYLLVIGTAGGHSGRDGLRLGDVVIADYIDYSAYWKLKNGVFYERRNACDHPSFHLQENFAEALRRTPNDWQSRLSLSTPDGSIPKVLSGAVVAGEMLLGDSGNAEQRRILNIYEKALAFEMESFGVARTVYQFRSSVHYNPQFMIIRGISDLVNEDPTNNNAVRKAWTPVAVSAAATFSRVLVERVLLHENSKKQSASRGQL
jgi:nucleoside phosphorylase